MSVANLRPPPGENLRQENLHQPMLLVHRHQSLKLSSCQRQSWLTVEYRWLFVDQLPAAYVKAQIIKIIKIIKITDIVLK